MDVRRATEEKDSLQLRKDSLQSKEAMLTKHFYDLKALLQESELALQAALQDGNRYREVESALANTATLAQQVESKSLFTYS